MQKQVNRHEDLKNKGIDYNRLYINDKLNQIVSDDLVSFHMPGHKKGRIYEKLGYKSLVKNFYKMDTTEIIETDDLHFPEGIIKKSQERLKEVFNSKKSYYIVNGSTCAIQASIMSVCPPKSKILINRDCHKSAVNTFILGDIEPVYIKGRICENTYTIQGVCEDDVVKAIDENEDVNVIMLTYPSYYGMAFDLKKICDYAHKKNMIVIVDEAHGAHLGLSEDLPKTALSQGADIVIQSIHKTLPSFTQSSVLHIQGDLVDENNLEKFLRIVQSSSPSYVLMSSLEIAIDIYEKYGRELMKDLIDNIDEFTKNIYNIKGAKIYKGDDITKLFVSLKDIGMKGYKLEEILRYEYNIQVELSNYYGVLLICTIANEKEDFNKFIAAIRSIIEKYSNKFLQLDCKNIEVAYAKYPSLIPKKAISPRDAFYNKKETILLSESVGKISGEYIIPYPPGISLISPGEIITKEVVDYVLLQREYGMNVNGLKDRTLETIDIINIK